MFSKDIISQSIIDAVSNVLKLDEKIDTKKRTTDTLAGRVKIPPTAGDNEHTDYKVELNAEETDKGESSTDAKGNKTTKYKDGSWQTETPTHKDDGKNPEGKVHHLSDVARRKMIKMNANNEEVELDEVLDTRKSIKSYLDKNDAQRTTLKASGTFDKVKKRLTGANKALDKLSKLNREEVELDEDSDEKIARVPKSKRFIYGHKVSFHAHGKDIVGDVSSSTSTHAKVSVDKPEKGDPHNWNVPHKHLTLVHDYNKAYDKAREKYNLNKQQKEEVELEEAKKEPMEVYHHGYSAALQHAEKHLNKQGYEIHPDDWQEHISHGPSKPSEGKTVQLHVPLHKDGVKSKKVAHIQVYNRGNTIPKNNELNMYVN